MVNTTTVQAVDAIEALYSWSLNFEAGANPFCLFLDLCGYSDAEYGCPIFSGEAHSILGYKEIGLLGEALAAYADSPSDCLSKAQELLDAEMED